LERAGAAREHLPGEGDAAGPIVREHEAQRSLTIRGRDPQSSGPHVRTDVGARNLKPDARLELSCGSSDRAAGLHERE
jgi:hypothetical protein